MRRADCWLCCMVLRASLRKWEKCNQAMDKSALWKIRHYGLGFYVFLKNWETRLSEAKLIK